MPIRSRSIVALALTLTVAAAACTDDEPAADDPDELLDQLGALDSEQRECIDDERADETFRETIDAYVACTGPAQQRNALITLLGRVDEAPPEALEGAPEGFDVEAYFECLRDEVATGSDEDIARALTGATSVLDFGTQVGEVFGFECAADQVTDLFETTDVNVDELYQTVVGAASDGAPPDPFEVEDQGVKALFVDSPVEFVVLANPANDVVISSELIVGDPPTAAESAALDALLGVYGFDAETERAAGGGTFGVEEGVSLLCVEPGDPTGISIRILPAVVDCER